MNLTHCDKQQIPVTFTARRDRIFLRMVCLPIGNDFVVTLSGGDREHIGAVAVSQTDINNICEDQISNIITNVIAIPKHKEDRLA